MIILTYSYTICCLNIRFKGIKIDLFMKTNIIYVLIAATIALVLSSCTTSKNSIAIEKPIAVNEIVKEENKNCFVVTNDGAVTHYKSLKLVTAILSTPYLLADGKVKIMPDEIKAYKDKKHYAVSQKIFYNEEKGHVATHVLPGFALKEKSGLINIYSLQIYAVGKVYKKYFLQNGDNGVILPFSSKLLQDYVKTETSLSNEIDLNKKKVSVRKIFSIVDNFNSASSITKN